MADLGLEINPDEQVEGYKEDGGSFKVYAPGWHKAVIKGSTIKDNSNNTGKVCALAFEIQDGSGSVITDYLNITHKTSPQAAQIGQAKLSKVALSIGHKGALTNTDVLHGRPLQIKLIKDTFESNKKDDNGNAKMLECNKITGYRSMAEAEADGGGDSGQASTPAEGGSSAKKGW